MGLFVVGSAAGSSNNPIFISTSPDGITWSNGATPWDSISGDFVSVTDIAWSPDLSLFAATGHCSFSGLSSDILTSSDAITWTQRHSGHLSATNIEWVPFLNEFLYQGAQAGSPPAIFSTSPDGTTWTDTTAPFNFITDGIWPFADTYLVSVSGDIYASSNGTTWSAHDSTAHGIQASKGAWSADLDLGVSLCQTSTPPNNIAICVSAPNPVTGIMDPHNIAHGTLASNTLTEDVEWYFHWGTSSGTVSSNSTTPETQGPGFSQVPVSIEIPGLDLGTTYYYRLVGTHRGITAYGATLSFTATAPVAPPLDTTDGKHAYYHNGEWHIVRDKV